MASSPELSGYTIVRGNHLRNTLRSLYHWLNACDLHRRAELSESQNHPVHRSRACTVSRMDNQFSRPGDGYRYADQFMHWTRTLIFTIIAALLGYAFCTVQTVATRWDVTTSRLSPDGKYKIVLEESTPFIDRNFRLVLHSKDSIEKHVVVFRSPDEGHPIATERFVWSKDSNRFLLLGKNFYVHDNCKFPNGEIFYLMMDVSTNDGWCNADQLTSLPNFGIDELKTIAWEFQLE